MDGRVRVPGWQRAINWEVADARELFDSIQRGYPIGTLLFWQRSAPAEHIEFGSVRIDAQPRSDAVFVVDGQQRITSLVRALAGEGAGKDEFALLFDTHSGQIVTPAQAGSRSGLLPFTEVLDSRRLMSWLLDHPEADRDAALELGSRVREFQVPTYTVEAESEAVVRQIFERTNNSGKPLTASQVFDGRFRDTRGDDPAGIRDVATALSREGFGEIPEPQVLSMMLATDGVDLTKADTSRWSATRAHKALVQTQIVGSLVISFLRRDAAIPCFPLLPYSLPMITLARFLHFFPEPDPWNRRLLARWLWRGALAEAHGGASHAARATLQAVTPDDESGSVRRLLAMVKAADRQPQDLTSVRFNFRHARAKVATIALYSLGPRHLETGERIPPESLPPVAVVTGKGPANSVLGNRLFHPGTPSRVRPSLAACRDPAILASHAVDEELQALVEEAPGRFVEARTERLRPLVQRWIDGRCRWDDADGPPLADLWGVGRSELFTESG